MELCRCIEKQKALSLTYLSLPDVIPDECAHLIWERRKTDEDVGGIRPHKLSLC
ncbi:hypothetical protein BRARA_F02148 [Brassica rapa]|uniref:Uncharacterized protein n=1 Tax=Brassica campestris TaxID=3711 RepID=A0A397YZM5_BRACM|nr:hypothetical protein BRARA_F02148 [Brassica rapa]